MKLSVIRDRYTDKSTVGMADIDGVFQCYTLEPACHAEHPCIPAGTYKAKKGDSAHFGYTVILVLDVPKRTDIEWHVGNFPSSTKGCTVVGQTRDTDFVGNSERAFVELMSKLPDEFAVEYVDTDDPPEAT